MSKPSDTNPNAEVDNQNRELSLAALALMRRKGVSFDAACNAVGIAPKTALRYVGSELSQEEPRGRYVATPYDYLPRTVSFLTPEGAVWIAVYDSRIASRSGEYLNALKTFTHEGDSSALESFKGESFEADGVTYMFLTDLATLSRLADAGELAIEGLYRAG
jgi:hypothetical protein